jgi:hypothetical protein
VSEISNGPLRNRAALYRKLASQAEGDAGRSISREDRDAFLRLAQQWEVLAGDAERFIGHEK